VQVSDGSNSCQSALAGGGMSCVLPSSSAGTRTLTAIYAPTGSFAASSGTASHVIGRANTTLSVSSVQPSPSVHGQPVVLSFAVSAQSPSSALPTGSVSVLAAPGGETCSASATAGSCGLSLFGVGGRNFSVGYAQTADFNASSVSVAHTVLAAATITRVESVTPSPSRVGQPYDVLLRVESPFVIPDGSVLLSEGAAQCTASLSGGVGSCRLTSSVAGARALQASYGGSSNFLGSSGSGTQNVLRGATALRVVGLYPQPSPVDSPLQVRWALDVLPPAAGNPSGVVVVTAGAAESCSAPIAAGGCSLLLGSPGPRSLQFEYAGDTNFEPASASAAHSVDADAVFRSGFEAIEGGLSRP
jgi:hypothetical protein